MLTIFSIIFMKVSIPHRYGKNFMRSRKLTNLHQVSIPHRYGKNGEGTKLGADLDAKFPFLIGTVRTCSNRFEFQIHSLFPFLIGTVRTLFLFMVTIFSIKFPFLIGTVRTYLHHSISYLHHCFHSS